MCLQIPKGGSVAYADVFKSITGNVMLDETNTDTCKVLFSRTFRPNDVSLLAAGTLVLRRRKADSHVRPHGLPPRRALPQGDIIVVVLCYDAYGSLIADNIGYMQMFTEMQYRDP
jgi:hypothetical protein